MMAIFNIYKNIFEDFVNSSNIELSNMLKPVDKKLRNVMPGFENPPTKSKLDENILNKS